MGNQPRPKGEQTPSKTDQELPRSAPELDSEALAEAAPKVPAEDDHEANTSDEAADKLNDDAAADAGASEDATELDNLEHGVADIPDAVPTPPRKGRIKRFFSAYWRHKKWTLPLTVLVVAGILVAVPWSRYLILGQFITKPYEVQLMDAKTNKPVSGAEVSFVNGELATTDAKGIAWLHARVGVHHLVVDKKYYSPFGADVFVGLKPKPSPQVFNLVATGRQVPLTVTNKITGKPLADATLKAVDTEVKTDKDGKVLMVLPADQSTLNITVSAQGYNSLQTTVQVTEQDVKQNQYGLTPSGQVYFLSKLSGKIDVVKSNLDGSNRQTVIGGTGREDDGTTQLLASRDWRYLALYSKRNGDRPALYLISTDGGKMTTIDASTADFELVGWSDHNFVYKSTRSDVSQWEPNRVAIKSFNAETGQTLTVDQNQADGTDSFYNYRTQNFTTVYEIGNQLVYGVSWAYSPGSDMSGKTSAIRVASVKSTAKKDVKTFPAGENNYLDLRPDSPSEVYVSAYNGMMGKNTIYEVDVDNDVSVKQSTLDPNSWYQQVYNTYLASPSGSKTLWSESRDGHNVFFVGDSEGQNGKQVASLDDYTAYGWYSDDYVLLSKKSSELYIMPVGGGQPVKVTDYHKPAVSLLGYGGGYGGL